MKPIVLLDVDGVLADFVGAMLRVVQEVTWREHTPDDVTGYDFAKSLGLTDREAEEVLYRISCRRKFCARMLPLDGAREGVARLRSVADIYVVTSPWNSNETWMSEREAWLKHYFDIHHSRVIHCSAKHLVRGDFLVDDKTETCRDWQAAHPNGVAVQWQTPRNRRDSWTGISTRSWDELCALVEGRQS